MRDNPLADLSPWQFGFRDGKSTYDAIAYVQTIAGTAMSEGGFTIGVSIDICNAFNSIPWRIIRQALINKQFPEYLLRIIDSYLHDRSIEYRLNEEKPFTSIVTSGVPQGSVLGPLLWNIAYDSVLQEGTERGSHIACYVDDTFVMSSADTIGTAVARGNIQVTQVLNRIRRLGLEVAVEKTEAIVFYGKNKPPRSVKLQIGSKQVEARSTLKYLGIVLDSRFTFRPHFEYVEGKIAKVNGALGRLMPNLRGPSETKRRLYAQVVLSVFLYII